MSEGLITRIGQWIDRKWKAKATVDEVREMFNTIENHHIKDKLELIDRIQTLQGQTFVTPKEFNDLKERLGHLEVYVGMKRAAVDSTKQPVAKSAFAM